MIGLFGMAATLKAIFAKNLLQKMKEAGLNQTELANRLGVSTGIVSRWANGKSFPENEIIDKMRFELGWSIEELFGDNSKPLKVPKDLDVSNALVSIADALGFEKPKLKRKKVSS